MGGTESGMGGDKNKEYCEERRRWEKRRLGRMRVKGRWQMEERGVGNPRGGVGKDGAERPRKGPKRETWETQRRDVREDTKRGQGF